MKKTTTPSQIDFSVKYKYCLVVSSVWTRKLGAVVAQWSLTLYCPNLCLSCYTP